MAKVKLELQEKNHTALGEFGTAHKDAMAGNANFPTPSPTAAVYDASLAAYLAKSEEINALEIQLATARAQRDELRIVLEANLTARGAYVQEESGGEEAIILSAAFGVQATGSATTSMPKPENPAASMGDFEGEIDVQCSAVPKAKSYIYEMREHPDTAAPGPWSQAKIATRSSASINGLVPGKRYAFRIRALGPNELESPWSDEVTCMAP